jgi:hypothetical protein
VLVFEIPNLLVYDMPARLSWKHLPTRRNKIGMNPSSLLAYYAPTPNPQDDFDRITSDVKPPLRLQPISTTAV